ncbi:MAG: hypothetical protein KC912_12855 [Proteobacteria bacterium]|nr:hypothetical protein [Pseudomonadota bacterium]
MNRLAIGLVAITLVGCAEVQFTDNIDLILDFGITQRDVLSSPYVRGAPVSVSIDRRRNVNDWQLQSEDPNIFGFANFTTLSDGDRALKITGWGQALEVGEATLAAIDSRGRTRDSVTIEVATPTHATLASAARLFGGETADEADVDELLILAGGTATFQVRYFDDERQLFGNAVLDADPSESLEADPRETFLFEQREWLSLTPDTVGIHTVDLYADGEDLGQWEVEAVDESAIAEITLAFEEQEIEDHWITVVAEAWTADGRRIYGVDVEWDREGVTEFGEGDLYRYRYTEGPSASLCARIGDVTSDAVQIHGNGYVDSSNNIGCSSAGFGGLWLGPLALLAVRRRETSS